MNRALRKGGLGGPTCERIHCGVVFMVVPPLPSLPPVNMPNHTSRGIVPALAAGLALAGGLAAVRFSPWFTTGFLMQGAAKLAGLFLGAGVMRTDAGWALTYLAQPILVTKACAATDFYVMATALLAWHLMRRAGSLVWLPVAVAAALLAAVPVTLLVNALRIVTVAHAHRWVISRMPSSYDAFLHMATGAAVFLPALIGLNLLLEFHGRTSLPASRD